MFGGWFFIAKNKEKNNEDRKNIHPHPHSRLSRQADQRLLEGEAAGGGRNGTGGQRRRDAERDECGGVPGENEAVEEEEFYE